MTIPWKKIALGAGTLLAVAAVGLGAYTWTPRPPATDLSGFTNKVSGYDTRIVRDKWGVPHIHGQTDADVAFGLGYAQSEDDWATMQEVILFTRGKLAQHNGKDAAVTDYMIDLLRVKETIDAKYETDLSPETRAIAEAYADGVTWWAIKNNTVLPKGLLPITGKDVIAGFVSRTPFFYGLDDDLAELFKETRQHPVSEKSTTAFLFNQMPTQFIGSNAFAVAPERSADGHTRLLVNSHQPYTGPVAWYEARLKSEEGWDMVGSTFPGAPVILHGVSPHLGWAHTVNKPDLLDIYLLETDHDKKPTKYKFDGEWKEFERSTSKFRVKLFGPFSWPVKREVLWSVHGPALVTDHGTYALRYAAIGEVKALEQWYAMNRATNLAEWQDAVRINGIPSFNIVYADKAGNTGLIYNARMPKRAEGWQWRNYLPGHISETLWTEYHSVDDIPQLFNPETGFVFSANHTPFKITDGDDSPREANFPASFGTETHFTNRSLRALELYTADDSITEEEFLNYRADHYYSDDSRLRQMVADLVSRDFSDDAELSEAQSILKTWNGSAAKDNRAAALAILTGMRAMTFLLNQEPEAPEEALRAVAAELKAATGRIDPEWGEVNRLKRGTLSLPLAGGPDTLRAVYAVNELEEKGTLRASGGDTHMSYADWDENGNLTVRTIHQFGSATLDETSPHYADQAPLFATGQYKDIPMDLPDLLAEATRDYRPSD
jgi:penicillin amidase/acyl-homoserine-lactone acylase